MAVGTVSLPEVSNMLLSPHFLTVPAFKRQENTTSSSLRELKQRLRNHHRLNLEFIVSEATKVVPLGDTIIFSMFHLFILICLEIIIKYSSCFPHKESHLSPTSRLLNQLQERGFYKK